MLHVVGQLNYSFVIGKILPGQKYDVNVIAIGVAGPSPPAMDSVWTG